MALFANILGQILQKLTKYDDSIQIDDIAHHEYLKYCHLYDYFWCFRLVLPDKTEGGKSWYCNFSLVFQCETVLSLIFSENTDIDSLGDLKKPFIFKLKGEFLAL